VIYYRIAVHTKHTPTWRWMTTKLTSLQAVLNYLQIYRCPASAQLRIFFASSIEALEEMLAAENQGDTSFSVPPEHLLSGGQLQTLAEAQTTAEVQAPAHQQTVTLTAGAKTSNEPEAPAVPLPMSRVPLLEARRLELELGTGGDRDQPYQFAFPRRLPEICTWMRLREQVQRGHLKP
jgi:hypothetical protein